MDRLTDDRTAQALRENIEKLKAAGVAIDPSNERYVRLAELERQIEWISVKDRMPEMNRDVIGFCASKEPELFDGVIEIVYLKDTINFLGEHKVTPYWCCEVIEFFRTNYEVTHWMPLPEPPKEVQDDE